MSPEQTSKRRARRWEKVLSFSAENCLRLRAVKSSCSDREVHHLHSLLIFTTSSSKLSSPPTLTWYFICRENENYWNFSSLQTFSSSFNFTSFSCSSSWYLLAGYLQEEEMKSLGEGKMGKNEQRKKKFVDARERKWNSIFLHFFLLKVDSNVYKFIRIKWNRISLKMWMCEMLPLLLFVMKSDVFLEEKLKHVAVLGYTFL